MCPLFPLIPPLPSFPPRKGKRRRWPSANQEVDAQHRLWIHCCPDLGPPSPPSCEVTRFCCLNHPVYGNFLWQPKWTKICSSADLEGAGKIQGCWRLEEKGTVQPWKFPEKAGGDIIQVPERTLKFSSRKWKRGHG